MSEWNDKFIMKVINNNINNNLILAAEFVEGAAKMNCPVRTGNLRNSITPEPPENGSIRIGTNVEYAAIVELGGITAHGHAKGDAKPRKAKPYLFPAIADNKSTIRKIMEL